MPGQFDTVNGNILKEQSKLWTLVDLGIVKLRKTWEVNFTCEIQRMTVSSFVIDAVCDVDIIHFC